MQQRENIHAILAAKNSKLMLKYTKICTVEIDIICSFQIIHLLLLPDFEFYLFRVRIVLFIVVHCNNKSFHFLQLIGFVANYRVDQVFGERSYSTFSWSICANKCDFHFC